MNGTITIGDQTRALDDASESWITDQIARRRREGESICVRATVIVAGVTLSLSTPACPSQGSGGGRPPTAHEQQVFDLWNERKLNTNDFAGGNVVAFLKQLRKIV